MVSEKLESTMTRSSSGGTSDLRVSSFLGAHLLVGRRGMSTSATSSEMQGDDQSVYVSVSWSSARPNAGRYRPKFNSKSLRTP